MSGKPWTQKENDKLRRMYKTMMTTAEFRAMLPAEIKLAIAERDARISLVEEDLHLCCQLKKDYQSRWFVANETLAITTERAERAEAELARVTKCLSKANDQAEHFEREWYLRGHALEEKEAELAQLRAQEPVAWMWNDMIGIPHTHISPTRPTWPDVGASSAMSVAINVRPLYAEQVPAKVAE